jgi:hypothetical protein
MDCLLGISTEKGFIVAVAQPWYNFCSTTKLTEATDGYNRTPLYQVA